MAFEEPEKAVDSNKLHAIGSQVSLLALERIRRMLMAQTAFGPAEIATLEALARASEAGIGAMNDEDV